ncbi:hypothetical protein HOF92_06655, partial [bacterium]|nr:hypothetical protein [bacterium]
MLKRTVVLIGFFFSGMGLYAHGPLLDEHAIVGVDWLQDMYQTTVKKHGTLATTTARPKKKRSVSVGDIDTFWTMNVATNQPMQTDATLRYIGKHCYIYLELEQDLRVSQETLEELANNFDNGIYPTNHKFFGSENNPGIDFDERVTLLFLDIQDGWEPGRGYVAGYFSPMDGVSSSLWDYSNEREMVYLDVNPGNPKRKDYLGILAHEFQHMIHANYDRREELWLNEAMAQIAFYVNDFGHAPQILAFIKNTDTQIDEFNNGLDDYGSVYLFVYYLLTKHIGSLETAAPILREIVASKGRGLESIETILHKHGIDVNLEEVISDWLIANFVNDRSLANGQYGYDDTLPMKVQPTHVFRFDQVPSEALEGKVNQRAADYIVLSDEVRSHPMNATLIDAIKIYSEFPGFVKWNINEGVLPPEAFIPNTSQVDGSHVVMPTQQGEDGRHFVEVGPFRGGGVRVTQVNYKISGANATTEGIVPVYSFQTLAVTKPDKVSIEFNGKHKFLIGKKKTMRLMKLVEREDGQKYIEEIPLNSKNDAKWSENLQGVSQLTIMPVSTLGGELKYTLKFKTNQSKNELSILDEWVTDEDRFLDKLIQHPNLLDSLKTEWLSLSHERKEMLGGDFRRFLHKYQFKFLNTLPMDALYSDPSETETSLLADDQDDSHDNLAYLLSKAREGTHDLSHLKIDPNFIEGQLMKLWKLLHIARGFPKWPLPEGLGLVDYKVDSIETVLQMWENRKSASDFESIRRLTLGQNVIVGAYNQGLTMADDAGIITMDMVTFFMSARWATAILLNPLIKKGGIKGKLAEAIKIKIQAKLIWVLNKVASLVSRKLRSPYNTQIPMVVGLITQVYRMINKIPLETDYDGWLKPFAYRTIAKYALMSVPKIGIVARGQKNVEYLAGKAETGETSHDVEDAADDVRIKLQEIFTQISATHSSTQQKREWADVTKKITEISALAFALDPTHISKIITLASTVIGTGLLAHSLYASTKTLYKIPNSLTPALNSAFTPFGEARETDLGFLEPVTLDLTIGGRANLQADLMEAQQTMLATIENLQHADLHASLKAYIQEEELYSQEIKIQEMMILGSGHEADDQFIELTQNDMLRSQLSMELLLENREKAVALARRIKLNETKVLKSLSALRLKAQKRHVISVRQADTKVEGKNFSITL